MLDRGRYLVVAGGCNACHTPGNGESGGSLPQAEWITGSTIGTKDGWGTSYPANLRLAVHSMSEQKWLGYARAERRRSGDTRPPSARVRVGRLPASRAATLTETWCRMKSASAASSSGAVLFRLPVS